MGCFVAPVASAIAVGCASGWIDRFRKPLKRLAICEALVGAVSAVEHVYHGEVTTSWPFLTGLATEETRQVLMQELATEGVALALTGVAIFAVWSLGLAFYHRHHRVAVR